MSKYDMGIGLFRPKKGERSGADGKTYQTGNCGTGGSKKDIGIEITMIKKLKIILFIVTTLWILISCSSKIRTIKEYHKTDNEWILNKQTSFNKRGNIEKEVSFGNPERRHVRQIEYQNNKKVLETLCEYFVKQDTCVLRQFKKYEYPLSNTIKETIFEEDSAIRLIHTREIHDRKETGEIKTWEFSFFTSKEPKDDEALLLTGTLFLDLKGRIIEEIHYNEKFKKPWKAKYKYLQKGYFKTLEGTASDGITFHPYNKLQQMVDPLQKQYIFKEDEKFKYEIEYY